MQRQIRQKLASPWPIFAIDDQSPTGCYLAFKVKGAKKGDKVMVSWMDNKGDKNAAEAAIG